MRRIRTLPGVLVGLALALTGCPNAVPLSPNAVPLNAPLNRTPAKGQNFPQGVTSAPKDLPAIGSIIAPEAHLAKLPARGSRAFITLPQSQDLAGHVNFLAVAEPFFADSAVSYGLLGLGPAANALVYVANLDDELFATNSAVSTGLSDATGAFKLTAAAPTDRACVVAAILAHGHRMSAIAEPGTTDAVVDEATTMVVENARWQLRDTSTDPAQRSLAAVTPTVLATLEGLTRSFVNAADFLPVPGEPVPTIEVLKQGAGLALRNVYVAAFGTQVGSATTTDADRLSDAWKDLLGFRPLALTVAVGTGQPVVSFEEGLAAQQAPLSSPWDLATDADGNLYLSELNVERIRIIPAADRGPLWAWTDPMLAGHAYTILSISNGTNSVASFNAIYGPSEATSVADPTTAPPVIDPVTAIPFPIYVPEDLAIAPNGTVSDLLCTTGAMRVLMVPGADIAAQYGRGFKANRIYTLAGTGTAPGVGYVAANDDGKPGWQVALGATHGLARSAVGDLFIGDDADPVAALRVLRESDGALFTLPMTLDGAPLALHEVHSLRLHDGWLYFTLAERHVVVRCPVPDVQALAPGQVPTLVAQIVLGQLDKPGFLAAGVTEPAFQDLAFPVPRAEILLAAPTALAFDGTGALLVADQGRVRRLSADGLTGPGGQVATIAGGLESSFLSGDARLVALHTTTSMLFEPATGNLLVADFVSDVVRRLWMARGVD